MMDMYGMLDKCMESEYYLINLILIFFKFVQQSPLPAMQQNHDWFSFENEERSECKYLYLYIDRRMN